MLLYIFLQLKKKREGKKGISGRENGMIKLSPKNWPTVNYDDVQSFLMPG